MRVLPGKDNPSLPEQNRDPNQAADRPNPRGVRDHGRGRLDRDPVVRGNAGLSGAARGAMVHRRGHAGLSAVGDLPMVVSLRRLCAAGLRQGRYAGGGTRLPGLRRRRRSAEHTSELQSLMRMSYAVFCMKKKKITKTKIVTTITNMKIDT